MGTPLRVLRKRHTTLPTERLHQIRENTKAGWARSMPSPTQ
jgi:hypothetical protein